MTQTAKNTLRSRVDQLCEQMDTNLKQVCRAVDVPYQSCRVALNQERLRYKNLGKIATFLNVNVEWIRHGDVKKVRDVIVHNNYINREMISFDAALTIAFDELDLLREKKQRKAVTTIVERFRFMELYLTSVTESLIDIEEILIKGDVNYSKPAFKRMKSRLKELRKTDAN